MNKTMIKKKLTVWESACIITGYGIGGGVMAVPYLASKNGIGTTLAIILVSFIFSIILHFMIAELAIKTGENAQLTTVFNKYLFKGKFKKLYVWIFFLVNLIVLCTNLAAYISGAAEIITELLGIPLILGMLLFYLLAASVVFFGLKAVGVSEKIAVLFIIIILGVLSVATIFTGNFNPLPIKNGSGSYALALFGMMMFSFSAFFSVPQAVEGLNGDVEKIKKSIAIGIFNNMIFVLIIIFCSLAVSPEVTEVAIIGWSKGIGSWAQVLGSVFTILAMLTTYWSISLALTDIIKDQLKLNEKICWLGATVPSLILSIMGFAGFMEFIRIAGGAIAVMIAVLLVPIYRISRKDGNENLILGKYGNNFFSTAVIIAYILMAVGSLISI